ncbi:hypothetical protein BDF19DRAFT_465522 [Syncephalis fuscata]|nr:hypothetical protein BDF19DRAFT_465522 [Syncephalis fuscata]
MEIYKKLSETTVKDPSLIAGKQFLPSVKHTFPFLKGSCAIVEYRCDESLQIFRYATALQPDFMRKSEMKRLYGQIKKGVDYLAKLGFLYNDEPIDICLNADMNVMLKDFGKALRLEMPKNLGGILTAEQAAKNNNAILIYHSKVKGFLSKPPTETEKAKAESDMTEIRSQIQMNRASSRRRRPENLRVLTRTGSGAIISSSSSSSSPESPSIEPLPLYELLPPPYTSKPLSPNSPSSQRGEPPSYESSRLDHQ